MVEEEGHLWRTNEKQDELPLDRRDPHRHWSLHSKNCCFLIVELMEVTREMIEDQLDGWKNLGNYQAHQRDQCECVKVSWGYVMIMRNLDFCFYLFGSSNRLDVQLYGRFEFFDQ